MKLLENKGFSNYKIGKISFIMDYDDIFRPVIIDGLKTRYVIDRLGNIYNSENKKSLVPQLSSGGYYRVQLSNNKVTKSYSIHRLVAQAFISNPFNKPDINHIDGIKSHNYVENLEWVTKSENSLHAFRTGLNSNAGEINPKAKLTEHDVISIWNDINMNNDSFINIGKNMVLVKLLFVTFIKEIHGKNFIISIIEKMMIHDNVNILMMILRRLGNLFQRIIYP